MRKYYTFYNTELAAAPLPSLATTYARWSAAELANGGLTAEGNWQSVYGNKTLLRNPSGAAFTYSATGLNGKPCLLPAGNASWYLPSVAFPADSAAAIIVLESTSTDIQVVVEFGENVNSVSNSFANYIESNTSEAYLDVNGQKTLSRCPQLMRPVLLASRFYTNPMQVEFSQNKENATLAFGGVSSSAGFGTKTLYVFSRNNAEYFVRGTVAAFHVFHAAPDVLTWQAWIEFYYSLYAIS